MKKYKVIWTELEDGSLRCDANNDGFSGMEILGDECRRCRRLYPTATF